MVKDTAATEQAPLEYIKEYYEQRIVRRRKFLDATQFYLKELNHVHGKRVMNVGCGPQLYDYLPYFSELPRSYFGVDINQSTFRYLKNSRNKELLAAKRYAQENAVNVHYVGGNAIECVADISSLDCILGVGFFGTFGEKAFGELIDTMYPGLRAGGKLVNISWYGCHLSESNHQDKIRYCYDRHDGPTPEEAVVWTEKRGFHLAHRAVFDVPDKVAYGWGAIQSCVFRKVGK